MKNLILFTLAICLSGTIFGQSIGANLGAMGISEDRYEGIEKSPYLFQEFAKAKVYDKKKDITDEYLLNYNGLTGEFEFLHNGSQFELDVSNYDAIDIAKCTPNPDYPEKFGTNSVQFVKGLDPINANKFQIAVHKSSDVTVYKDFRSKISVREYTDPSKGKVTKKLFAHQFNYYKLENGEVSDLKLNKKKVIAALGNDKVESYVKKHKLSLSSENELKQVMAYYSELKGSAATLTASINILPEDDQDK